MGEYEPDDSRTVTQSPHRAPGEPPRTGPREDEARAEAQRPGADPPNVRHQTAQDEADSSSTARDAAGTQQKGFAAGERTAVSPDQEPARADSPATVDADEDSVPLGK